MNKKAIFIASIAFLAMSAGAQAAKTKLDLGEVMLEDIEIKGRIQTWSMSKVCINGQAYILLDGVSGPNGIAPAFKDGKPEQCTAKPKDK